MSEVLSNDQIAALVEAAREGQIPEPAPQAPTRRPKRVREVDFTRPTKFTQDQQRRIGRGHEAFCRAATTQLSAEYRTSVQLEVINVDQQTWSSALAEIPQPSLYGIVSTAAGAPLLLSIEQPAVTTLMEWLLGGVDAAKPLDRDLTEIELTLATRIFGTVVAQLSRTWQEILSTDLALGRVETQVSNVQLAPQSEPALAVTIELQIERLSATMSLLIPYRSVESLLEQLSSGHFGDGSEGVADAEVEQMVRSALRGIAVEVRAEVGSTELTVDEVLALEVGDLVKLGPAASGGTLYADSVPIHRTRPGRSGNRRAVEVLERIDPE
jgi:flagellar motor switch protein FliM